VWIQQHLLKAKPIYMSRKLPLAVVTVTIAMLLTVLLNAAIASGTGDEYVRNNPRVDKPLQRLASKVPEAANRLGGGNGAIMAFYVHVPKTGGNSIQNLLQCAREATNRNDAEVRTRAGRNERVGTIVQLPVEAGIINASDFDALCRASTYDGSSCKQNHHWKFGIWGKLAGNAVEHGYRPLLVPSVRNPFAWYVSTFMWRHSNPQTDSDDEVNTGNCPSTLGSPTGPQCFRRWLNYQLGAAQRSLQNALTYWTGPLREATVEHRWVRTETLYADVLRIWEQVTGVRWPAEQCPQLVPTKTTTQHMAPCMYYDDATQQLVLSHDRALFDFFKFDTLAGDCAATSKQTNKV
jgi:hypothetical protein